MRRTPCWRTGSPSSDVLDLDDLRAHVGEEHRAERPGQDARQVDDANALRAAWGKEGRTPLNDPFPAMRGGSIDYRRPVRHSTKQLFVLGRGPRPHVRHRPLRPPRSAPPPAPTTACRSCSTRPRGCSARRATASTSMRDIARAAACCRLALLPLRVQGRAARRRLRRGRAPHHGGRGRRARARRRSVGAPRAACAAHLEALLLEDSDYAQVVIRVRPDDVPEVAARLTALRDDYERTFAQARRRAAAAAARPTGARCKLMLLGALNWSQTWYRSGRDSPAGARAALRAPAARAAALR